MNETARKLWEMMADPAYNPRAYDNIDLTRSAFPIYLDVLHSVCRNENGLIAFGMRDANINQLSIAWVGVDESLPNSTGYQHMPERPFRTFESFEATKRKPARRTSGGLMLRLSRAWHALFGREE